MSKTYLLIDLKSIAFYTKKYISPDVSTMKVKDFFTNLLGGLMIAEGALTLLFPKKYVHLWRSKKMPTWWNEFIDEMEHHDEELRIVAGVETILGLVLLLKGSCCKKCSSDSECNCGN